MHLPDDKVLVAGDVLVNGIVPTFQAGVKAGYKRGQDEAQIRKSLDLAAWEKLERAYVLGRNINRAYLEAEADSFDE